MSFKKEGCAGKIKGHPDLKIDPEKEYMTNTYRVTQKNIILGKTHNYRIEDRKILGRGSFSSVYLGTNLDTHEKVAIKKMSLNKDIDMVEREIRIVTKLIAMSNPYKNIVTYHDVIKTNATVFIIMEMCPDGTFSSLLVKPMKEKFTRYYFKQIIDSLKALHELNIIHRDIKPDNILIFNDYKTLKICDFGFSQDIKELDNVQSIRGSPIYMAPESFHIKTGDSNTLPISALPRPIPQSCRRYSNTGYDSDNDDCSYLNPVQNTNVGSDLWAAGIVFYEMVYGYHPHRGSKDVHTIKKSLLKQIRIIEMPWTDLGQDGFQLLRDILDSNSLSRISIDNVMKHPWIETMDEPIKKIILSELFYLSDLRFISRSLPQTLEFNKYVPINDASETTIHKSNNNEDD